MSTLEITASPGECPLGRSQSGLVRKLARVLDYPALYNLWQTPFAGPKMKYFLDRNVIRREQRVLDVGCGPASNTRYFPLCRYLGIDLDVAYIAHARRRSDRRFEVADAASYARSDEEGFDFVFFNSVLHHLDDERCAEALRHASGLLSDAGRIHVLDMVLPERHGLPRWLARHDRGEFARTLDKWKDMFARSVLVERFERFQVRRLGVALLDMCYMTAKGMN